LFEGVTTHSEGLFQNCFPSAISGVEALAQYGFTLDEISIMILIINKVQKVMM